MPSLRVLFRPNTVRTSQGKASVPSAELSLGVLGAAKTIAKRNQAQPAEIVFYAVYLSEIRGDPKPEPKRFATLEGELLLEGPKRTPVFRSSTQPAPGDDVLTYDEPLETTSPRTRPRRRSVEITFAPGNFRDVLPAGITGTRLFLPHPDDETARFAEIDTELHVGGDVEASLGENHRLDLPLPPIEDGPMFEWPDALTDELPPGLTLTLSEGGKSMSLPWESGTVADGLRRFVFNRLPGVDPCTLVARAGSTELTLLSDQALDDLQAPIKWEHWLEDIVVPQPEEEGDIDFPATLPFPGAA